MGSEREDRISMLPDELIHQILSFLDTRLAVQTSILSKRWKLIWTNLPFLNFDNYDRLIPDRVFDRFLRHVFCGRNQLFNVFKLKVHVKDGVSPISLENRVKYAISHNIQDLNIKSNDCDLSVLRSNSLKMFKLAKNFGEGSMPSSYCWDLPALTSLHLEQLIRHYRLPESCFINYLSALRNLRLDGFNLPPSFRLPCLTSLHLKSCELPQTVWDLPALISLKLEDVVIPANISEFLSSLVSLRNLKLFFCFKHIKDCLIHCHQLVDLELRTTNSANHTLIPNIFIYAPKLCNVNTVGIFSITCGDCELENVNIKLHGCFEDKDIIPWGTLKQYCRLMLLLPGLCGAKILTLDFDTIEALSAISYLLERSSSPFYNLKYVKLPKGYKQSSICGTLKSYLLDGSPGATIVTTLPQSHVIPQIAPPSLPCQNVVLEKPLKTLTMELFNSQGIHKKVCTDTLEVRGQEEHVVQNSGLVDGQVRQFGALVQRFGGLVPNALGADNDCASSSGGTSDFGLWQSHEVNSEFVGSRPT